MARFMKAFLMLVPLFLVQAGCGGSTEPTVDNSFIGVFSLQTINGTRLPFVIQSGATSISITNDRLTIVDGGSWSETLTYTSTVNGAATTQIANDGGPWLRVGNNLSLTSASNNQVAYGGTFSNGTLHLSDPSFTYVFTKRPTPTLHLRPASTVAARRFQAETQSAAAG